jgi:hypothetical protein
MTAAASRSSATLGRGRIERKPVTFDMTRFPHPLARIARLLCGPITALAALAGCAPSPLAERQIAMREQKVGTTVYHALHQESKRPARLQRTVRTIERGVARHDGKLAQWPDRLEDWVARDEANLARLEDQPPHPAIERLLYGQVWQIEPVFVQLFY